jgi:hypothetical protein
MNCLYQRSPNTIVSLLLPLMFRFCLNSFSFSTYFVPLINLVDSSITYLLFNVCPTLASQIHHLTINGSNSSKGLTFWCAIPEMFLRFYQAKIEFFFKDPLFKQTSIVASWIICSNVPAGSVLVD